MFKIRKGNTRIAIILFNYLVLKFPNPRFSAWARAFTSRKSFWEFLKTLPVVAYDYLIYGVAANVSEGQLYRWSNNLPYLVPVFSLGIVNFQRYMGEECPTNKEMSELWKKLPEELKALLLEVDCHEYGYYNWRKTPNGLKLIDYAADPLRTPWARFLRRSVKELTAMTTKK